MRYQFQACYHGMRILGLDAKCFLGYVSLPGSVFHLENVDGDNVAIVGSFDEVIPALEAHYDKCSKWQRDDARIYFKWTRFGLLEVEQDQSGKWSAFRNKEPLLRDDEPAIFQTLKEGQRAAEAHLRDGLPESEPSNDGFTWRVE